MFKIPSPKVAIIDIETVPDVQLIKRVYNLSSDTSDEGAVAYAYLQHGATPENPKPFLKPMFQKIVSVSLLYRQAKLNNLDPFITLNFHTLPKVENGTVEETYECEIIERVLGFIGKNKAQVVGWNSVGFDLPVLFQRAIICGATIPDYCQRPAKPWDGTDYFTKYSDANIDLMDVVASGQSSARAKLGEFAQACGIPGKIAGIDGLQVWEAYQQGRLAEIVAYNEFDVCTTYLIWLRMCWIGGHINAKAYAEEQETFRLLLQKRIKEGATHFEQYLSEWAFF